MQPMQRLHMEHTQSGNLNNMKLQNAAHCAKLSELVYKDKELIRKEAIHMGYTKFRFFEHDGTECLVCEDKGFVVVVFRGTEPNKFKDIAADLKIWRVRSDTKGRVHAGFKESCDDLYTEVFNWITKNTHMKKIIVTGHSLGAAVATLFASRINADELYTFGSPRVGNRTFVRTLTVPHWRFVNNNDVVTKVPPALLFKHDGELRYINSLGEIADSPWYSRLWDGIKGRVSSWLRLQLFDGIRDHSVIAYKSILNDVSSKM